MPFRPEPVQPEFNDLVTSLSNSKNQIKDNPLYQTVFLLIKRLTISKDLTQKQIKDIDEILNDILAASFLTVDDESSFLVNSRREIAGANITLDDSVPHVRKISSSGGGTTVNGNTSPVLISEVIDDHEIPLFVPGAPGTPGAPGATGAQGNAGPPGFGNDGEDGQDGFPYPGIPGAAGAAGTPGAQGNSGPPGIGIDGEDGLDGFPIPGPAGTNGTIGRDGLQGPPGMDGESLEGDSSNFFGTVINSNISGLKIAIVAARVIHGI